MYLYVGGDGSFKKTRMPARNVKAGNADGFGPFMMGKPADKEALVRDFEMFEFRLLFLLTDSPISTPMMTVL